MTRPEPDPSPWGGLPRFKEAFSGAKLRGLTARDLSTAVDVDESHISHILSGRRNPGRALEKKLAQALGVSVDWLLGRDAGAVAPEALPEDWELVPKVAEQVAAGLAVFDPAAVNEREWYAFRGSWLRYLRKSAGGADYDGRLVLIAVARDHKGESMIPTIRPGALLLVDRGPKDVGITSIENGAIYLVRPDDEDGVAVKRVFTSGTSVVLWSDNPAHQGKPGMVQDLRGRRVSELIAGRVRWVGQALDGNGDPKVVAW